MPKKTSRESERGRENEGRELDEVRRITLGEPQAETVDRPRDPLFVPHLERMTELAEAEAAEDPYAKILETICGTTDDSQPVEQYDGTLGVTTAFVNAHQRPVAQVQWNSNLATIYTNPGNVSGVRWGSGTMISVDLFLTAGHLFDQTGGGWARPRVNGTMNVISSQDIATNMHLNFDYQVDSSGNARAEVSFPITQLVEYRLGGVDFAICRIGGSPGNTYGWTAVSTADAALNDALCVIGHPAGQRKRIEAGPCTGLSGNEIRYNGIDTLGGNSGSGILHGPSGQLVGVHTNGGCNAAGTGYNYGMRISVIRAQSSAIRSLGLATAVLADVQPTVAAIDAQRTLMLVDVGTRPLLDVNPTMPRIDKYVWDEVATDLVRDIGGTVKRVDDVKVPAYDKLWDNPAYIDPGVIYSGPGGAMLTGGARPFVLATPHHSPVLGGLAPAGGTLRQEYEAVLVQLEAAIAQAEATQAELAARLEAVRAEYQETFGAGPSP